MKGITKMKLFKVLAITAILATSLTACLKDKSAEPTAEETAVEAVPTEGQPTEEVPADAGTTQSAE